MTSTTEENGCRKLGENCQPTNLKQIAYKYFPILTWLPKYDVKRDLRYDIIAGLTVGLTAVPQSLAYAQVGNLAPQYGLYSCFMGMIVYFFMGTAKDASIGPSALLSMLSGQLTASAMPPHMLESGDPTCATILALFAGIILTVMGFCKLGFLVSLFSVPVVSGFTSASGFAISASQLAPLFGLKGSYQKPPGVFVRQLKFFFENLQNIKKYDAILGGVSIAFLFFMQFMPKVTMAIMKRTQKADDKTTSNKSMAQAILLEFLQMISAARNVILFAVVIPMAYFFKISKSDVNLTLVGEIPAGFPSMQVPKFYLTNKTGDPIVPNPWGQTYLITKSEPAILKPAVALLEDLAPGVVVIVMMASLELFAIEKALGRKNGYRIKASQELICIGIANFLQGFLGGVSVTAAVTRCALNDLCRVKTQLASIITAAVVMSVIGLATDIIQYVPKAALSAIIISAAVNLIEFRIVKVLWQTHRQDCAIFFATFILCLFYDIAYGIIICLMVNMLTFLRPVVKMKMFVEAKPINLPGSSEKMVAVVRLPYGMKYPSADKFSDRITSILTNTKEKYVLIDCQFVTGIDYTGLQAFKGLLLAAISMEKNVMFANVSEKLGSWLDKMGVGDSFRTAATVEEAVAKYISPDRQTSSSRLTPQISVDKPIAAFQFDRSNVELIHQLSVEPSFYADIPISVGTLPPNARAGKGAKTVQENASDLISVIIEAQNEKEADKQGSAQTSPSPTNLSQCSSQKSLISTTNNGNDVKNKKTVFQFRLPSGRKPALAPRALAPPPHLTKSPPSDDFPVRHTSDLSFQDDVVQPPRRATISSPQRDQMVPSISSQIQRYYPEATSNSESKPFTAQPASKAPLASSRETDL